VSVGAHDLPGISDQTLRLAAASLRDPMRGLLCESIRLASPSGREGAFTRFVEQWARGQGFETDLWETDEAALANFPEGRARHLPLAGRPTLVIKWPGADAAGPLILNAHADVVPGEASGVVSPDGTRVFGRGACDDKGPLVGALWALQALRQMRPRGLAGDVLLELVPGEEDSVGLGTLTSMLRGYRGRGAVVLEPTENVPRSASRGGLRFEVVSTGRSVHGTVKWLGRDAIASMRRVLAALETLESRWNDRAADDLFSPYPIARPVTVDQVRGGEWQGMVCDRCAAGGYLELLPGDDLGAWRDRFEKDVAGLLPGEALEIRFTEAYGGHRTPADDPLCVAAARAVEAAARGAPARRWPGWSAFNSGCEAGLRSREQGTPTIVWGPGSLAQAHAPDEFIELGDVERFAGMLAHFIALYMVNTHE
jgi:acetylornithine deacetylase